MNQSSMFSKQLCMSALSAQYSEYAGHHYYDALSGKKDSSFGFLVHGRADFIAPDRRVQIPEGGIVYIPEGCSYRSTWTGNPKIAFFSLHITSPRLHEKLSEGEFCLQCVNVPEGINVGEIFERIYRLLQSGNRVDGCRALSEYYRFFADILPVMKIADPSHYHPAIPLALRYIEQHSAENFDIGTLAGACCVSESTLYHLFRDQLRTTPVACLNETRIRHAIELLRSGNMSVADIGESVGFHSAAYFRKAFRALTDLTPSAYRKTSGTLPPAAV